MNTRMEPYDNDFDTPEFAMLASLMKCLKVTEGALSAAQPRNRPYQVTHSEQLAETIIELSRAMRNLLECYKRAVVAKQRRDAVSD